MIHAILQILAIIALLIGTFFSILGVVGLWRFPDVYTRLHATGKVGVFGVVLLLIASALTIPGTVGTVVVLSAMLLFVGPVSAHALASVAYRQGIRMRDAERDDLKNSGLGSPLPPESPPGLAPGTKQTP